MKKAREKGNVGIEFGGLEQGYPHDNTFSHYSPVNLHVNSRNGYKYSCKLVL